MEWIKNHELELKKLALEIWHHPEEPFREYYAAETLSGYLESKGFSVVRGVADIPTAFEASWGKGHPVIGLLAEYDALHGLSQNTCPYRSPIPGQEMGHGCGHNLLGTCCVGAAVEIKHYLEESGLPGTIILYGCPAEEIMAGKIFMARAGCFDKLDLAFSEHPHPQNMVNEMSSLAMNTVRFNFRGHASHASISPERGRSALDAVELMNVGVNYLREHIPTDVRVHYSITNGGGEPNIVPENAQSWYYIRAPHRVTVDDVFERVVNCARGAALMTGTEVEVKIEGACRETVVSQTLSKVLYEAMVAVGPNRYTDEEKEFARKLIKTVPSHTDEQLEEPLCERILPLKGNCDEVFLGSSDISDVSNICPVGTLYACCVPKGISFHSWQFTACTGSSIGLKGMIFAAKTLAEACRSLYETPALVADAREEFRKRTGGRPYVCPIPPDVFPEL